MKFAKLNDLAKTDDEVVLVEEGPKVSKIVTTVLVVVGALTVIGVAGYFLWKYLKPDYLEDYEEDFDDDDDDIEVED